MTLLDGQLHVGVESTYGTPVAPTRSFMVMADEFKRSYDYLESNGFRSGIQGNISTRRTQVLHGVAGKMDLDLENKGFGMLFKAMLGSATIAQQGSTGAYLQTHTSTANGPSGYSLTVQLGRSRIDGSTTDAYTYEGCKVPGWTLAQAVGQYARLSLDVDGEDMNTSSSLASSNYVTSPSIFSWKDLAITVSGSSVNVKDFSFKADNNLHVDRRELRGLAQKLEPLRKGLPAFTGTLALDYSDQVQYNLFANGNIVPIVATWTGPAITATINSYCKLTLGAVQFIGDDPNSLIDDLNNQGAPFVALYDLSNPVAKIEYMSAGTTY